MFVFVFSSSGYGPAVPQPNRDGAKGRFTFVQKLILISIVYEYFL